MTDGEILDGVITEFVPLTRIPRPSGHEKAVSDYLLNYLRGLGLEAVQDRVWNIIADFPASPGLESVPLTILQSHMDMVCVAAEGKSYDPLTDGISCIIDGDYMRADGTSLGADDGFGIAEILFLLKNLKRHGKIRVIFTVDEETGMTGAVSLEDRWLKEAAYLINCDSEDYDILTIGSAGGVDLLFSRELTLTEAGEGNAFRLEVSGLLGGHSGEEINVGRANAIVILARTLQAIKEMDNGLKISSISGGVAKNAIPAAAEAVLVTSLPTEKLRAAVAACRQQFGQMFAETDNGLCLTAEPVAKVPAVFSSADAKAVINLILSVHSGVYAMSQTVPGMVETSANLGMVYGDGGALKVSLYPRSAVAERILDFCQSAQAVAGMAGFELEQGTISPAWKERLGPLARNMADIFREQNGRPMKITSIHAGLECSWHIQKNPQLDMVSIGVTTHDIHSPKERVDLRTVAPQVRLIAAVLERICDTEGLKI